MDARRRDLTLAAYVARLLDHERAAFVLGGDGVATDTQVVQHALVRAGQGFELLREHLYVQGVVGLAEVLNASFATEEPTHAGLAERARFDDPPADCRPYLQLGRGRAVQLPSFPSG